MRCIVLCLILLPIVLCKFSSSSESCSSEIGGGKGRGHGHGHGRRTRAPRTTRPPPPPPQVCEPGWMEFDRPFGKWCIKVGMDQVNYVGAKIRCGRWGAVLTGYQNANERIKVGDEALKQLQSHGHVLAGMWLGGQRNGMIMEWNDGVTTGTEGMKWGIGQPDWYRKDTQWCMQQFIIAPAYWNNPSWTAFQHNDLDDYWCLQWSAPPVRMFACGKHAVVSG